MSSGAEAVESIKHARDDSLDLFIMTRSLRPDRAMDARRHS